MVVHPQSHFPFPEDVGVDVSVGMSTSIGLKKVGKQETAPETQENVQYRGVAQQTVAPV